jgi:hypothetical protein
VLTTCKTIIRKIVVRDSDGTRVESSYCIASVITDERYRKLGLATVLLSNIAAWLDNETPTNASMLYSSAERFYVSRGWDLLPSVQVSITGGNEFVGSALNRPATWYLRKDDLPALCKRDVDDALERFGAISPSDGEVFIAVLPSVDIISWLQDRAEFFGLKIRGRVPHIKGAICGSDDVWAYWYHDFRHTELVIQRVRMPESPSEETFRAVAQILLDAVEEARRWEMQKVVFWNPGAGLRRAMQLLADEGAVDVLEQEMVSVSVPSVRWKSGIDDKKVKVFLNEFYAWS